MIPKVTFGQPLRIAGFGECQVAPKNLLNFQNFLGADLSVLWNEFYEIVISWVKAWEHVSAIHVHIERAVAGIE